MMFLTREQAADIVAEMAKTIPHDINIMDENGVILASTNFRREGAIHAGALRILQDGLPQLTIQKDDPENGVQSGVNLPITAGGQTVGVIGITGEPEKVVAFGEILRHMTELLVENVQRQEQLALEEQARALFVENWLFDPNPDWASMALRGRLLGIDLYAPYTVALLELKETPENRQELQCGIMLRTVANRLRDDKRHYGTVLRNRIMVLLCAVTPAAAEKRIRKICEDLESFHSQPVYSGISAAGGSPEDLRTGYLQAQTACSVARQSGRQLLFYRESSLEFVLESIPRSILTRLREMVFARCTEEERKVFLDLIHIFFQQDGDLRRIAERLYVHRNTVQYRIDKLEEKTGFSLQKPRDAVLLYLSIAEI